MLEALLVLITLSSPVRIAVIGDRTGGSNDVEFTACLRAAQLLGPDIVVNSGDLIEGYSEDADILLGEWDSVLGAIDLYLGGIPFVFVPGNHDITYDAAGPVWESRLGIPPNRIEEHSGIEFVVWDSSRLADPDSSSLAVLESLLACIRPSDTAVLLTHRPFWMMSGVDPAAVERMRELIRRADIEVVLGGHIHLCSSERRDGVLYATIGASGGDYGTRLVPAGAFPQIGWMTLEGDSVSFSVVDPFGILPGDTNTVEEENLLFEIENGLLRPRPLEQALESASLALRSVEPVDRLVSITLEPGGWRMSPDSVEVALPAGGTAEVHFSQDPGESPYPLPVLHVTVPYGDRGKVAVFETAWQALRVLDAPASEVTVDGIESPGEYPGRPETCFAGWDGSPSSLGAMSVRLASSRGSLCAMARMTAEGLEDESFGVVLCSEDRFFRVKVFPDGGVSAVSSDGAALSSVETGFEAAVTEGEGWWQAEISVCPESLGISGNLLSANIYRLGSSDRCAVWSWPLEFEQRYMGRIQLPGR